MDNKIITMFKTMIDDIDHKLKLTIISGNCLLFDNNLQIFDQK
jgi:hypothetical protein